MKAEIPIRVCNTIRPRALRHLLAITVFAVVVACASSGSAWAQADSPAPKSKQPKAAKQQTAKGEQMVFTGSFIRRNVPRHGQIAVTESPLVIIDRKQIEQSGASTVAGVLRRYGASR